MAWPLSQDYNEAIQSPESSFADPELRGGQVVTNTLGMPMPRSGNFADVYEFVGASGVKWAIKCFTREVPGLQERYEKIDLHLLKAKLPFAVGFQYQQGGILIKGKWYPILKMQWVEGFLLNEFVRNNLDKPALLEGLGEIWLRMARRLREVDMAHADLQHGNVLLVPGRSEGSLAVKLIDYDGMWVPALANKKSGEVGHPAYQHPLRLQQGTYSADVDRLPLLAITCALRCLVVGGKPLWDRYDNGDNLLFREADLKAPDKSALFKELQELPDPQARMLVEELRKALTRKLEDTPAIDELLAETKVPSVRGPASPPAAVRSKEPSATSRSPLDFDEAGSAEPKRKRKVRQRGIPIWALVTGGGVAAVAIAVLFVSILLMVFLRGEKNNPKNVLPIVQALNKDGEPRAKVAKKPTPIGEEDKEGPRKTDEEPTKDGPKIVPPDSDSKKTEPPPPQGTPTAKFNNSIGMKFVWIPPGSFMMGSPKEETRRGAKEIQHTVTLTKGFFMGVYTVTQEQWKEVMGNNPSVFKGEKNLPVLGVTWDDCHAFIKKLREKDKKPYRLPTEAEWEYACRAGTTTPFHFGETISTDQANYNGGVIYGNGKKGVYRDMPLPVGSFPANAWGLHDMHGNVGQWCQDWLGDYPQKDVVDPQGPDAGQYRVARGGSWVALPWNCRSADRGWYVPFGRNNSIGLRVCFFPDSEAVIPVANTEDFVPLFNGKDLTGWRTQPAWKDDWQVKDGILTGSGQQFGILYTERNDYKNFHVVAEMRILDSGPEFSAFAYRSSFGLQGYEARMSNAGLTGSVFVNKGKKPYGFGAATSPKPPVMSGDWFKLEIITDGDIITTKVNDKTTLKFKDPKQEFTSGHLAFRHGPLSKIECRKIEIKELKAENATPLGQPITNGLGMKFVWIPPGSFLMGSPKEEKQSTENQHKVTLTKGFYMGVYTVTQEQWMEVMGNNPSNFKGEKNLPVENVSWDDCQEFVKKLREKDKMPYRLPTEAEWEYACRAGTTTPFHFGETISTGQANYGSYTKGVGRGKPTPVGTFPANAWGLHDMHGNVAQWCQDWWGNTYLQDDVIDPQGPKVGTHRTFRGGSWKGTPVNLRSASRAGLAPSGRSDGLGFRVCFFPDSAGPAVPTVKKVETTELRIIVTIDGKDILRITPTEMQWTHQSSDYPTHVKLNNLDWDPKKAPVIKTNITQLLGTEVDLSKAKLTKIRGRGPVALMTGQGVLAVIFDDAQPVGSDIYEIKLSFPPAIKAETALPQAKPPQLPPQSNGISMPGLADCAKNPIRWGVAKGFDITKSWFLSFDFFLPDWTNPQGEIFFWGDDRPGLDPISICQDGPTLAVSLADCRTNGGHRIEVPLTDDLGAGKWIKLTLCYRAQPRQEVEFWLNDRLIRKERCQVIPFADRPMPVWFGGANAVDQRFRGKIRNVRLGNF